MRFISSCLLLVFSITFSQAQTVRATRMYPPLIENGEIRSLAFAGGLNSPQFSKADFNDDGQEELFIFDRVGNVPMVFEYQNDRWVFQPVWLGNFPEVDSWALLRDYDQDGIKDLFTYNAQPVSGIRVFKGKRNGDGWLYFERLDLGRTPNILHFPLPGSGDTQIFVSEADIPAFDDIDEDGDLDILTFSSGGGYVEYYRNQSIERGNTTPGLDFILETNCWGGFYESGLTNSLELAEAPGECTGDEGGQELPDRVDFRHAGSTLLTLDEDSDGDRDIILGDVSFAFLNMASNGGTRESAWMNAQDEAFPSYDISAELPIFPAAFYEDVDGDNIKDMLVSTNMGNNGIDHNNVWKYKNLGTDDNPDFQLEIENFLEGEMLDMGTGARPAMIDHNADGLMDLVVGNFSFYEDFGLKNTRLHLYENTGTSAEPAFTLVDDDFMQLNQFSSSTFHLSPTFGDLDNDGDWDALVGEQNGRLFFVENTAGEGNPVNFSPPVYNYKDIHIGLASNPQIIDVNRDGLADILLGERSGNVNYYVNVGSVGNPDFGSDEEALPNIKEWGGIDVDIPGGIASYASAWMVDADGDYRLFVGSRFGLIYVFDNIDGNLDGEFRLQTENISGIREGSFIHPLVHDFNNDGLYDIVVGNYRGGLGFFSTNMSTSGVVDVDNIPLESQVKVFPNPAKDQLSLQLPEGEMLQSVELFDVTGRSLPVIQLANTLDVSALPAGIYWLRMMFQDNWVSKRVVVE